MFPKKDWNEQISKYTPVVGQHKGGYVVTCHRPEGIISWVFLFCFFRNSIVKAFIIMLLCKNYFI